MGSHNWMFRMDLFLFDGEQSAQSEMGLSKAIFFRIDRKGGWKDCLGSSSWGQWVGLQTKVQPRDGTPSVKWGTTPVVKDFLMFKTFLNKKLQYLVTILWSHWYSLF